jgi:adenylate cyclase
MEGSVRKAGDRVRVTAQLVNAANGYHLWSENFDRSLADIFSIQEEIARNVVNAVRPALQAPPAFDLQRHAPRDMRAYEFYLRGRQASARMTEISLKQSPSMFRSAIEIDPNYAQAWAGLSDALCELMLWRMINPGNGALEEAKNAAHRALELDPDLAEAHVAKGHSLMIAGDHDGATEAFEHAIKLDPELYVAYYFYGRHCFTSGNYQRGADLFVQAHRVQPDEFQALALAVNCAAAAGDLERTKKLAIEGLACASHQAQIDPENARAHYMSAGLMQHLGVGDKGHSEMEYALRIRPTTSTCSTTRRASIPWTAPTIARSTCWSAACSTAKARSTGSSTTRISGRCGPCRASRPSRRSCARRVEPLKAHHVRHHARPSTAQAARCAWTAPASWAS